MKSKSIALLSVMFLSLALAPAVHAGCRLSFTVENGFANVPLNIDKIKTAAWFHRMIPVGGLIYKTQWTGNVTIPVGQSRTFSFWVDKPCYYAEAIGNESIDNIWNVRVFRENGKKHTCSWIDKTTRVTLTKPKGCAK